jgi:hypothetical protein
MASTKCSSCNGHRFEIKEVSPIGSKFKYLALQCSSCGSVMGIVDYWNIGVVLKDGIEPKLNELESQINNVNNNLNIINYNIKLLIDNVNKLK